VFPTVFSALAFRYVSWVVSRQRLELPDRARRGGCRSWAASFVRGLGGAMTGVIALDAGIVRGVTFVLSAPIGLSPRHGYGGVAPCHAGARALRRGRGRRGHHRRPGCSAIRWRSRGAPVSPRSHHSVPDVPCTPRQVLRCFRGAARTLAIIDPRIVNPGRRRAGACRGNPARADDFDLDGRYC